MKFPTSKYRKLEKDLRGVKGLLRGVPDTQNTTNLQHLKVQSYIFLAHAAFEEYLEGLAELLLNESVNNFNTRRQINKCIISLIVSETIAQFDENIPRKKIQSNVVKKIPDFINIAKRNHLGAIQSNTGIKLRDQRALLLPVGIDPEEVDTATANSLDAFGTKRGGVAHQVKIQTEETRSSVLSATATLLKGLRNYDEEACKVINEMITA